MNDIHPSVRFGKNPTIRNFIFIGENCVFGNNVRISNYCNIDRGCRVGNNVNLQTGVYLAANTEIGDDCFFSVHAGVADEKYPAAGPQIRKPVVFGNNVVVGMGAKIIGGVTIGDNAVIGIGAVVTKDISANEVWVGNPAEFLTTRQEYDRKKELWEAQVLQA
jgi:acetyltransferase-like isoleucine patch superfamily enzyme